MFFILFIVIGLVAWALHLMQAAIQRKEFSLMLAGFLVSVAAAAMMSVYFLMSHYVGYMTRAAQQAYYLEQMYGTVGWSDPYEGWNGNEDDWYEDLSSLPIEADYKVVNYDIDPTQE